ncbi:Auxin efflux carrier [Penicillium lagena]|uniref:Auxin efflux carrier n=1 Tax=Penicillium lagena TaxID=94218 RepID=UPI002540E30C|nr:Auxin efflux carrier [Penicillium lagena]KAJ5621041.1 Auxin efflux carrier [Penicillium lagena]
MGNKGLVVPFLGALQACISVLLTMCYGVAARRLRLIHEATINDMSGLGVKLFLPALIIVNLGRQLHLDTALNYLRVLIWSALHTCVSIIVAHLVSRLFKLPQWVTPTCSFNNPISHQLFLLESLKSVGSLRVILHDGESMSEAIDRAQSYFLVCTVIAKSTAYAFGPKMLHDSVDSNSNLGDPEERHRAVSIPEEDEQLTERTSLLPRRVQTARVVAGRRLQHCSKWIGSFFPHRVKQELMAPFGSPFVDVVIGCTLIGAVLGLVPALHRAFFFPEEEGGMFSVWLTSSVRHLGQLFTTLQIFMVGCKLGVSFEQMIASGDSGRTPVKAIAIVFLLQLVLWPAMSISLIYGLASSTTMLGNDPMVWFSMMLMPVGPPSLVILGLAELAKASEREKMAIAKTLTIMYALSPLVCFAITGALTASEAVLEARSKA